MFLVCYLIYPIIYVIYIRIRIYYLIAASHVLILILEYFLMEVIHSN